MSLRRRTTGRIQPYSTRNEPIAEDDADDEQEDLDQLDSGSTTAASPAVGTEVEDKNEDNDHNNDSGFTTRPRSNSHHGHHHHHKHHVKKPFNSRFIQSKRVMFLLGTVLGLLMAGYTAHTQDLVRLDILTNMGDLSSSLDSLLEDFKDLLPASILREAQDIESEHAALSESFAVGSQLRKEGLRVKHPVVLVPGVISTGLESWGLEGTEECPGDVYFRKRMWGSWYMLRSMLLNKSCWLKHVCLDPNTGLDPPNFKLRAAQGMEAADFFVAGYWIWNKILENLAGLGYDVNTMAVAAYDWRLAYPDLERRDQYLSKLKAMIEGQHRASGQKVVLAGHSMGSQIIFYFLKWVEAKGYGDGGPHWVNDHIESYIDISGSTLGTPKAVVALLSGEMKDTVQLNALAVYGLEKFFSRRERADMLRTFGGIASMLPKGGNRVWGNLTWAPDDGTRCADQDLPETNDGESWKNMSRSSDCSTDSFGNFIRFTHPLPNSTMSSQNLTVEESIQYLYSQTPEWFRDRVDNSYSHGVALTRKEVEANNKIPSKWSNPLEAALPNAPDMKIFCFYGVGKPTERSYYYEEVNEKDKNITQLNVTISTNDKEAVVSGQGDGTVSLITHTMCHRWKEAKSKFNPGNSKVTVVEMLHQPDRLDIRGGAKTAEHVDILGRTELNELVLKVAAGEGHTIEEKSISNIQDWVYNIDLGEN